jgi:hypothetical protein
MSSKKVHVGNIQRENHMNYYGSKVHNGTRTLMMVGRKNSPKAGYGPTPVMDLGREFNHHIIYVTGQGHVMATMPVRKRKGASHRTKRGKKKRTSTKRR